MIKYYLMFDGASRGNPGIGGCGAVLYNHEGNEIASYKKYLGKKVTNNEAEYSGLIVGLQGALFLGIKSIVVKGDSQLIIKQMKGEYKVHSETLKLYHEEAKKYEKLFDKIEYNYVPRKENQRADTLSNEAIDSFLEKK